MRREEEKKEEGQQEQQVSARHPDKSISRGMVDKPMAWGKVYKGRT